MKHFTSAILLLATAALPAPAAAVLPHPAICPADPALADLVAYSDVIVAARMDVPREKLIAEAQRDAPGYLGIPFHTASTLKGSAETMAALYHYPKDRPYLPSNAALLELADTPAILFLSLVDDAHPAKLYFAQTPAALKPASEPGLAAIRIEVARQATIQRNWKPDADLRQYEEVRALLASLGKAKGEQQQRVLEQLEALGPAAVPAIVAQMDDRRTLGTPQISVVNRAPDAFEGIAHYGPKQVVDALSIVLAQITGKSFGDIHDGGSDRERSAVVAAWRVHVADLDCRR